jgi:hypothetical protein
LVIQSHRSANSQKTKQKSVATKMRRTFLFNRQQKRPAPGSPQDTPEAKKQRKTVIESMFDSGTTPELLENATNIPDELVLYMMSFLSVFPYWLRFRVLNKNCLSVIDGMLTSQSVDGKPTSLDPTIQPTRLNLVYLHTITTTDHPSFQMIQNIGASGQVDKVILRDDQLSSICKDNFQKRQVALEALKILNPKHVVVMCFENLARPVIHEFDKKWLTRLEHLEIVGVKFPTSPKNIIRLGRSKPIIVTFVLHGGAWWIRNGEYNPGLVEDIDWRFTMELKAPNQDRDCPKRNWTPEIINHMQREYDVTLLTPIFQQRKNLLGEWLDELPPNQLFFQLTQICGPDQLPSVLGCLDAKTLCLILSHEIGKEQIKQLVTTQEFINRFDFGPRNFKLFCETFVTLDKSQQQRVFEFFENHLLSHWKFEHWSIKPLDSFRTVTHYQKLKKHLEIKQIVGPYNTNPEKFIIQTGTVLKYSNDPESLIEQLQTLFRTGQLNQTAETLLAVFLCYIPRGKSESSKPWMTTEKLLDWIEKTGPTNFTNSLTSTIGQRGTLLHLCILGGCLKVAEKLIKIAERKQLDVKMWLMQKDRNDRTVLDLAKEKKRTKFVNGINKKLED